MKLEIDHKNYTINEEIVCDELSHFVLDGKVYVNAACYADLDMNWCEEERVVPEAKVIFMKKNGGHSKYIDWVINKSEFKDFYITKDVEDGFTNGFEINLEQGDYDELIDALRVIRMTYEFKKTFESYLGRRRTVAAHIEAVLYVVDHFGFGNGHTLADGGKSSFHTAVEERKPFNKCKEYITCAV